jgi:hypothetical protein
MSSSTSEATAEHGGRDVELWAEAPPGLFVTSADLAGADRHSGARRLKFASSREQRPTSAKSCRLRDHGAASEILRENR